MKKPTKDELISLINRHMLGRTGGAAGAADAILARLGELNPANDPAYPESFAEHPQSVTEIRANRAKGGADVWTVRDALIAALRAYDGREDIPEGFELTSAVVILVAEGPDNDTALRYFRKVRNTMEHVGILDTARFDLHAHAKKG